MSVKSLISMMDKTNIADDLSETELTIIANDVLRRAQEDLESMKDWIESVDEGLKLCKPEFMGKPEPWEGSANFKSTLLTEASNNFGNRGSIEVMRDMALVKAEIIGIATRQNIIDKKASEITAMKKSLEEINQQVQQAQQQGMEPDPAIDQQIKQIQEEITSREKVIKEKSLSIKQDTQRCDRVIEMQNWQINHQMKEWRRDMKRLFYSIPNVGTTFKKVSYDPAKSRCVSDVINYPNFIVNQATVDQATCRSFTHVIAVSKNKIVENVKSGLWVEPKIALTVEDAKGDIGSNEANGVESAFKNEDCFFEQYCWIDLDDDGYEEPYIVTVHKASASVVRIVARYNHKGLIVKYKKMRALPILEAQRERAAEILRDDEEFGTTTELPDAEDFTGFKVVRIEPFGVIVKYGFIPSYDGTYLDVGFFHLIGALTLGVNKATNDLLNSGTLANSQMGMSAKGFRKRTGDFRFKMGQIMSTEMPAEHLHNSIKMLEFREPSMAVFQLSESMKATAGSFAANVDAGGQIMANTAPTTALAITQESLIQHTAHIGLLVDSMGDEFEILFELNSQYLNDEEYRKVVGDDEASYSDDFATDGLSIVCGANPEMSSRSQRMMLANAELMQVPLVMQAGGNAIPIIKNYFKRIGSENLQEIFPNEAELSPEDKAQMEAMQQQQQMANQLAERQDKLLQAQTEILLAGEKRKDAEFEERKKENDIKFDKILAEVRNINADTLLSVEKALTEKVNNGLAITGAISAEMDKVAELANGEIDPNE